MPKEVIRTYDDTTVNLGWPADPELGRYVQLGVTHGEHTAWAVFDSPDQVAELRKQLNRASRRAFSQ